MDDLDDRVTNWTEIGKRCSAGRRSLWMKVDIHPFEQRHSGVVAIELKAGREGDDAHVRITCDNPQFAELLELLLTARFAATT